MDKSQSDIEFISFPKIARLRRECVITEKIDGTNAQICITQDGEMLTGSRNRWLTPENDNHGFAAWVRDNKEELLTLGPGRHYGEWWGSGIQRTYWLDEKRFSLFNVHRWCLAGAELAINPSTETPQEILPPCVLLVPVLYRGLFSTESCDLAIANLKQNGSSAAPGFTRPEGIICYHVAAGVGFKKTIDNDESRKLIS